MGFGICNAAYPRIGALFLCGGAGCSPDFQKKKVTLE